MKRGEIWWADVGEYRGHEQGGHRPVVILQNDIGNTMSPTVVVAMITGASKTDLPTHVILTQHDCNLRMKSTVMLEQLTVIDKVFMKQFLCTLSKNKMQEIDEALAISLGLKGD